MTVETASVKNNLVVRDDVNTWRWFDAFGPNVVKTFLDGSRVVSTTTAAGFTITQTNGTVAALDSTTGGAVKLTLGGADNDKVEIQSHFEPFYFANKWPFYFGARFQVVDADQQDISIGFVIRDTDIAGGVTDGIYLRVVDESAACSLVLEKNSTESTTTLATLADATDVQLEVYGDGDNVYCYVNSTLTATIAATDANWCNDEHLTFTVANQAGEATANNLNLYWARAIQVQAA